MLLIGKKSGDGPLAVICFPIAIMKWAWSEKHERRYIPKGLGWKWHYPFFLLHDFNAV